MFPSNETCVSIVEKLESQPELNNRIGSIVRPKNSQGYYTVCLDETAEDEGSIICLARQN
jgi:hypothetical protein